MGHNLGGERELTFSGIKDFGHVSYRIDER